MAYLQAEDCERAWNTLKQVNPQAFSNNTGSNVAATLAEVTSLITLETLSTQVQKLENLTPSEVEEINAHITALRNKIVTHSARRARVPS